MSTEREILKRLVEAWEKRRTIDIDSDWTVTKCVHEAKTVLATTDPEPEHPAVEAYRKWCNSMKPGMYSMAEGFLAGWKQALWHIADNFDGQAKRHLVIASEVTPTQLP